MEIKTKPATAAYVDNYDKIFAKEPPKRYRVPVDVIVYARNLDECAIIIEQNLRNIVYELPVGYPIDEHLCD